MMYTSGWPKNQKRSSHRYDDPPCTSMKKAVGTVRSRIPHTQAMVSVGLAVASSTLVTRIDHTNIGSRPQVMPGAR